MSQPSEWKHRSTHYKTKSLHEWGSFCEVLLCPCGLTCAWVNFSTNRVFCFLCLERLMPWPPAGVPNYLRPGGRLRLRNHWGLGKQGGGSGMRDHRSANRKAGEGGVHGKGLLDGRGRSDLKSPQISSICGHTHCRENKLFFIPSSSATMHRTWIWGQKELFKRMSPQLQTGGGGFQETLSTPKGSRGGQEEGLMLERRGEMMGKGRHFQFDMKAMKGGTGQRGWWG